MFYCFDFQSLFALLLLCLSLQTNSRIQTPTILPQIVSISLDKINKVVPHCIEHVPIRRMLTFSSFQHRKVFAHLYRRESTQNSQNKRDSQIL